MKNVQKPQLKNLHVFDEFGNIVILQISRFYFQQCIKDVYMFVMEQNTKNGIDWEKNNFRPILAHNANFDNFEL